MVTEVKTYASFSEFYPFYLSEHSNRICRQLHFAGTNFGIGCLVVSVVTRDAWWILAGLVAGYAFAWSGHYFFEKNRPATFTNPLYSFAGDWVMWKEILSGKIKL